MKVKAVIDAAARLRQAEESATPCAHLRDLFEREERLQVLPKDLAAVQAFMAGNINA